jgi:hypothetical protein
MQNISNSLSQIDSVFEGKTPRKFISENSDLFAELCDIHSKAPTVVSGNIQGCRCDCTLF